jgi:zinc and cadmium transporter
MPPAVLLLVYCLLILVVSLIGGWIPLMVRLTHQRMQVAVSLVAGVMLGVGLLHMLPHALMDARDAMDAVFGWALIGFLAMFFIERFFCYHHHDLAHVSPEHHLAHVSPEHDFAHVGPEGDVAAGHHHDAEQAAGCAHLDAQSHSLTWSGAAIGLTLHTIIAGIALAASVQVEARAGQLVGLAGLGTFLVIFLHKPFDAMSISTLMTVGGWSVAARHLVNGVFALMIPVGVVLFHLGLGHAHGGSHVVAYALAFSAGTFLCISMSDLLPELQFHRHDRGVLSIALVVGLLIAWGIGVIESGSHGHEHEEAHPAVESHEHDQEPEPGPEAEHEQ